MLAVIVIGKTSEGELSYHSDPNHPAMGKEVQTEWEKVPDEKRRALNVCLANKRQDGQRSVSGRLQPRCLIWG